ncbi:hypothetical protein ACFLTS_06475 [Chloroflexota bacterium]
MGQAFLCESLTEYLFKDLLKRFGINTKYLRYIAALAGVILCLSFGVDLFGDVLGLDGYGASGEVLTGLILGRGSNYIHDFYSRFFVKKNVT